MNINHSSTPIVRRYLNLRWSINTRLIILFLALSIIPTSIVAYYNLTLARGEITELARENLMELSRSTAHRIGQLLTENQRTSATLAGEPSVVQFLTASEQERQALVPQVQQTLENFSATHPDYGRARVAGCERHRPGLAGRNPGG